jgi:hypothetical protein
MFHSSCLIFYFASDDAPKDRGHPMNRLVSRLRLTELDRINLPQMAERIAQAEVDGSIVEPRRYPGYPTWPLPRRRWWLSFDATVNHCDRVGHHLSQVVSTVPLGGCLERDVAHEVKLPRGDCVLYAGLCGRLVGARGQVFGFSELAGRMRGLETTLNPANSEKPNTRPR